MDAGRPRLRGDLTIRELSTASGLAFVVKDPISGDFFRLREAEHFIAMQLDGETALEVVRQRAEEKFGAALSSESLVAFIGKLKRRGLLESRRSSRRRGSTQRGRLQGGLLYARYKLFDPAALFRRLEPKIGFFYSKSFVVLSAASIALGVYVAAAHWGAYTRDLSRLYQFSTIPIFFALAFLVVSLHEMAHGLTCTRYGGEVREMGFMLIYFQPALYCNVSDAWLFPEKSKRLLVGFSGPYFELFLWSLATLLWRVTDTETLINHLALIVMTGSGIKTLLNFSPLIKLDGYYLLSDALEIPNLRAKAFAYFGEFLRHPFARAQRAAMTESPRERFIYLVYGFTASIGSLIIMGYVFIAASEFLIAKGQTLALAGVTALVGVRMRRRYRRLFARSSSGSEPAIRKVVEAEPAGEPSSSSRPDDKPERKRKRGKRRWIRPLVWAAVLGVIVAGTILIRMDLRIVGPFNIRPIHNVDIRAEVQGLIEEVFVDEGDEVGVGDPIARLSDKDLRVEFLKTEAEIRQARAQLEILEQGPIEEEIKVARAAVAKAFDQLVYARSRVKRLAALTEQGLVSKKELEDHQELAVTSKNTLDEAEARLDALLASVRPEQVEAMRANILRLTTQRDYLEGQLKLPTIASPVSGIIATPSRELKELRGRLINKGDLVAKVYDFRKVKAQILISEKEIAEIHEGQEVVLRARSYPNIDFHGTVTSIATTAASPGSATSSDGLSAPSPPMGADSSGRTILITTVIENPDLLLKAEMTGQAKIYCGKRRIIDLMTRRIVRTFKVEFWSMLW